MQKEKHDFRMVLKWSHFVSFEFVLCQLFTKTDRADYLKKKMA